MGDIYQVVAECAHVTITGPTGKAIHLLLKGAIVPADAPELERLLGLGYVAKVGGDETGGVNADGVPAGAFTTDVPAAVTSTPVQKTEEQRKQDAASAAQAKAAGDLAEKRRAAQEKVAALNGAVPDGRASQEVWVEYLVARGSRYENVAGADKAELQKLAKQQQS